LIDAQTPASQCVTEMFLLTDRRAYWLTDVRDADVLTDSPTCVMFLLTDRLHLLTINRQQTQPQQPCYTYHPSSVSIAPQTTAFSRS